MSPAAALNPLEALLTRSWAAQVPVERRSLAAYDNAAASWPTSSRATVPS